MELVYPCEHPIYTLITHILLASLHWLPASTVQNVFKDFAVLMGPKWAAPLLYHLLLYLQGPLG